MIYPFYPLVVSSFVIKQKSILIFLAIGLLWPSDDDDDDHVIIITTRPKPAYGRQGLVGSWGPDTDEVSTFLVFLTSHFAPAALSSDLNQSGTIINNKNPPGLMKTRPGAINNMKTHLEPRKTNLKPLMMIKIHLES